MNPFPPQAYTRETLVKAYQWLQAQSPQLKELASTPDLLISLYQKAQMQGREALERPTLANFKSELKSLAGMMGEFETHTENQTATFSVTKSTSQSTSQASAQSSGQSSAQTYQQPIQQTLQPQLPQQPVIPVKAHSSEGRAAPSMPPNSEMPKMPSHMAPQYISSQIPPHHASQTNPPVVRPSAAAVAPPAQSIGINDESLAQLQTIMREMNLSSTDEALKLALTIGFGRLAELFPQRGPKRS